MKQIQNRQKMMVKPRESAEKYLLKRGTLKKRIMEDGKGMMENGRWRMGDGKWKRRRRRNGGSVECWNAGKGTLNTEKAEKRTTTHGYLDPCFFSFFSVNPCPMFFETGKKQKKDGNCTDWKRRLQFRRQGRVLPRHSLKRTLERLALQLNPALRDCDSISKFMSRRFQSMAVPVRAAVTSPASTPPMGRTESCRYACRSPYRNRRCFCCCTD